MLIVPPRSRSKVQNLTEEEITSTVFGPLHFMPPQEAWYALVEAGLIKGDDPERFIRCHSVQFERFYHNPDHSTERAWRRAAPDAVCHFQFGDGKKLWLVVEVKWSADQSSRDEDGNGTQLARQWIATTFAAKDDKVDIKQAYLTLRKSSARSALEETKEAKDDDFDPVAWLASQPVAITWAEFCENLGYVSSRPTLCGRWAQSVLTFLEIRNVKRFNGFNAVKFEDGFRVLGYRFEGSYFRFRAPPSATPFRFQLHIV